MARKKSPASPHPDTHVRVPPDVLMRIVGEEMVLLDLDSESYYGLNPVGARMMQLAESGATLAEIADRLLEEFDVARAPLEADVRRIAAELLDAGLLEEGAAR